MEYVLNQICMLTKLYLPSRSKNDGTQACVWLSSWHTFSGNRQPES